ncbi:MAG: ABC transporter substrate-binding protein [Phycisphaerae bacterium]|nr:ABC transporter substrate-binding protein [Phycisphaerae bacterium]MCZ2399980.1 ABC transporter substrate-binding protein [Phycisphaerae bacterium]NUQ49009.1 ABC transporter substrate-binding protein [Phycisphaerae bacterium]
MLIRLAHSPDPDDAFMFYGLSSGGVDPGPYQFEHILEDIQTLNERARRGQYEVSAISIHAYPYVAARYALCSCGSSMGDNYGPMVIARTPLAVEQLAGKMIAVPGLMTTAFLGLSLLLGKDRFTPRVVMFDQIPDAVARGEYDAGLIIHEGQLTYERLGLHLVVDLGRWWMQRTGLPLPLGGNVIRRDLGRETCDDLHRIMRASIRYSLDHREEAVAYALRFGRGLDQALADRFVGMYVNEWTLDYGERGREAVRRLLREGAAAGLTPDPGQIEFLG